MIKIAHEAPKCIFNDVQKLTDYDYALVHLLEEDPEYLQLFTDAIKNGREVILDNSIFELEEAFDEAKFANWVDKLRPEWYIIPDALEDNIKTQSQAYSWHMNYRKNLPGKAIGVVQGRTYDEIRSCYMYMDRSIDVDMIAISFDYSYYNKTVPHPDKLVGWMLGRIKLLSDLNRDGFLNRSKPHHLLGCSLPQEFMYYRQLGWNWLYSLDTSNPVVHGMKEIRYKPEGLWTKESQKLFELINADRKDINLSFIENNIMNFRKFARNEN